MIVKTGYMFGNMAKSDRVILRATVLVIGTFVAVTVQQLSQRVTGIDLPLSAAYPAVMTIALAFGAVPGVIATGIALAYALVGPGTVSLSHVPSSALPGVLILFLAYCLIFCGMVALLERRRTVDVSSLLKDLGAAEERLRLVANSMEAQLVLLLDHGGRIVGWYNGHCPLTGWTEREILGMSLSALYPAGPAGEARAAFDLALAREQGQCRSIGERRHRSGALFAAETTLSALWHSEGFCVVIRKTDTAPVRAAA